MQVLAFDLGASSGRGIIGELNEGRIELTEIHRFENEPVMLNGVLYWDFLRLFHELKKTIKLAQQKGYQIASIGIDSWGVDYGVIDKSGQLMGNPVHYRDERAQRGMERLLKSYSNRELKEKTGMDCVSYNTVNQLMEESHINLDQASGILNIPDLLNYFLTGIKASEYSMATTTQLFDYSRNQWNDEWIKDLGFRRDLFQEIIPSGTVLGPVKQELCEELQVDPFQVVCVTSHDTAAAIQSVECSRKNFLFVATGTWIIVGAKQEQVTMNQAVLDYGLSNEGGKYPSVNLLKNHVGLWLIQESKRQFEKEGQKLSFSELVEAGRKTQINTFIDIMDERFFQPGNMLKKIREYAIESKQKEPSTVGEYIRIIEQSLGKQIAITLKQIEEATGMEEDEIYLFGGGIQDELLCECIEEYSGKKVIKGAKEATALGNILDQL
ncbi:MAG: rhamnulokinase, partial [Vallitaleaceae bacterium]|nr:rhamnulokinase [Vallitaleaceae bacterium]